MDPRREVDDELSFHIEMRTQELVGRGESPERARSRAVRRFGDVDAVRGECLRIVNRRGRRMARTAYIAELRQDIGYALRGLRRAPGFTAVAIATLALAIGANSAIFSVVRGVLLEPLPFYAPDRLYDIRTLYPDGPGYTLSPPDFMSIREDSRVFEGVEAYTTTTFTLLGMGEPREAYGARVSDGLFELLGLPFALGRGFLADEHTPGLGRVAVLGHEFWERELGGEASVLDSTVRIAGDPYTVVGVLAAGAGLPRGGPSLRFDVDVGIYVPLEYDEGFSATTSSIQRRGEFLRVLGRALPELDVELVETDLRRVGGELQSRFPDTNEGLTFHATSLRETIVGEVRTPLLVLLGAVGFVLLVACANVANLLLARSSARQGELAVRAALGAGRGRLLRQLLTEAIVLGLLGSAIGIMIAYGGTRVLVAAQPADIPRLNEIAVDGTVVLFTLVTALLTGLVFGSLPALQATSGRLLGALRESGRGAGGGGHRMRAALVVVEMALAVVLLTGAGLLVRSFVELTRVDTGFRPERAIAMRLQFQGESYPDGQQVRTRVDALLERLESLPGTTGVAATTVLPLSGLLDILSFGVDGAPPPPSNVNAEIGVASVTPAYFQAIGTPLLGGRAFTDQDRPDAPAVAIVTEAAVHRWFGGADPVGRQVTVGTVSAQVVGVVGDVLHLDPGQAAVPQLFMPYAQRTTRSVRVVVQTSGDPVALAPAIRAEIRELDPNLPVADVMPLKSLVSTSVARPRFYTSLLAAFAVVGLLIAAVGIFGVMSYTVAQRQREIGIRLALGASAATMLRIVVGRGLVMAATGAVIGAAVALGLGGVLKSQLFGVGVFDPFTLVVVVLLLGATAAAASYLPARRATRLEPEHVLRAD